MILHDLNPDRPRKTVRMAVIGLGGLALLALQACTVTPSKPKYPIYMQDRPAPAVSTAPAATPEPVDETPATVAPSPSGSVSVSNLEPPPPPPPPVTTGATKPTVAPASTSTAPVKDTRAAYSYVIQPKDTLYGVSRRFGVPVKDLYALNDLTPDTGLRVGQKVLLPVTANDKGIEEHANGPAPVKLATAVASTPPAKPAPTKPATPVNPAKPVVAAPSVAAATPPATKPVVTAPPASTPAATPPPSKPVVAAPSVATTKPAVAKPATAGFPVNTQIAQMGKGKFVWPVKGRILVPFGQLAPNVRNDGINIASSAGAEVKAAADGVVVYEGDQVKELGNTIYIKHDSGWYTGYSHLQGMKVKNNERVSKGQVIGTVGQTGTIDQPQLHFEIRYTPSTDIAKPVDPTLVLP